MENNTNVNKDTNDINNTNENIKKDYNIFENNNIKESLPNIKIKNRKIHRRNV